jgi:hypothetical protein
MLSFDAMKSQAENELSALAAGILWITGAAMILTPSHLNTNLDARALTSIFISGIFCYEVALSVQRSFTRHVLTRQDGFLWLLCGFTLLAISGLLIYRGLYIESFITLATGSIQVLLVSNPEGKVNQCLSLPAAYI